MAGPVGFVGRDAELSRLLQALAGNARSVLVVGDAGVGKTRFVAEGMLQRAAATGMMVLRGQCLPVAVTLPLLPLVSALRDLAGRNEGGLMAAALEAAPEFVLAEISRLLPQLGAGSEPDTGGQDGTWRRERLFAGVAELLAAAGQRGPVGLLVEDVHWADSDTLDCLTVLSRTRWPGRLTVVVTCRADEAPLPGHVVDWLAQVRGAADTEEIVVPPMSRPEVAQLAVGMAGDMVPPQVVDELYRRAGGNPFFTEQLVAAALASPAESGLDVPAALPGRLAALLAERARAALVTPGRCWPVWRWRAALLPRIFSVKSLDCSWRRSAGGCGNWPRRACWPTTPTPVRSKRGTRCWPRRWPRRCFPASGPRCTSASG